MSKSIRRRLQFWYGAILTLVVSGFALFIFREVRLARWRELDAGLIAATEYIDSGLRGFPGRELDGLPPPDDRPPDRGPPDERPPDRRPPPPPEERPPDWRLGKEDRNHRDRPGEDRPRPDRLPPKGPPFHLQTRLGDLTPPGWDPPEEKERAGEGPPSKSGDRYFAIYRHDGVLLVSSGLPAGFEPPQPGRGLELRQRGEMREAVLRGPHDSTILVSRSIAPLDRELAWFARLLGMIGSITLVVGLAGGWFFSARILRPIRRISDAAARISAVNLHERIDAGSVEVELSELATVLNSAFAGLEEAFARQTRFTADASHELRTPLAVIKSHAELALARPRSTEEYRGALEACLNAADRMTRMVEGLLLLARADAGRLDPKTDEVDLTSIVEETVALLEPQAREMKVNVSLEPGPDVATVGDAAMLSRVVMNLVANAIRYNRPEGRVKIGLTKEKDQAVLRVEDTGVGISAEERPRLFERFHRVDHARSRASGGTGLGLAICKSIVEAHRGTIEFESRVGQGTAFTVRLPVSE